MHPYYTYMCVLLLADARFMETLDAEDAADTKAKEDAKAARGAARTAASTSAAAIADAKPRSTSAGRGSIYKASSAAAVAMSNTVGSKKVAGPPLAAAISRKPSVSAIEADKPAEENSVINAKRSTIGTTSVAAPIVPSKDVNKTAAPAVAKPSTAAAGVPKEVVVSEASKVAAAKILAQL
jgi:hypothetical protein